MDIEGLFRKDKNAVRKVLLCFTPDYDTVDEWMQDTYLKAMRQQGTYRAQQSSELTWLCNVARSVAIDHLRAERTNKRPDMIVAAELGAMLDDDGGDTEYYDRTDLSGDLLSACEGLNPALQCEGGDSIEQRVASMPSQTAAVFKLRFEGHDYPLIAAQLGLEEATVRWHISEAKKYFAE